MHKNRRDSPSQGSSCKEQSPSTKSLLMPLFLMGCFPVDFQEVKRPLWTKSAKRPIKVGKRPINEGKRPIKAKVLVGVSVGCLMGCFSAPPPWRKTAPLKRPIKRSMTLNPNLANRKLPFARFTLLYPPNTRVSLPRPLTTLHSSVLACPKNLLKPFSRNNLAGQKGTSKI